MNFLQLCQALARDSGTVAGVPNITSVAGASGRVLQVVGWVRDAWIDIQNERPDWRWMVKTFAKPLVINQMAYTASGLGIGDFGAWLPDVPADGVRRMTIYETGLQAQEGEIVQIPYPEWRARYLRGSHTANKPTEWAISPQNELSLGTKPDKAYIVTGEYRRSAQELVADADTPEMPAQFHRVIIGEALRLMSRSDEAFQTLIPQAQQYERLRSPLVIDQTPPMSFGGGTFA